MTNAKTTKRALISSVLALFLCFAMLLGTTFAWFTDSVTSANNIITAGNLDVELYYQVEGQTDWTKVTDQTNIFKTDALWEPGHTEVVKLKVVNEGTLALKYQLGVNVATDATFKNALGDTVKLSSFIKYGIVDGAQTYTRDTAIAAVDATATQLNAAYKSAMTPLAAAAEQIVTMVVYMPTSVGNEANPAKGETDLSLKLGINLLAIQQTAEADSFGDDYDENAMTDVYDVAGLQNALNAGATNITIKQDITLDSTLVIPASATSTYSLRNAGVVIDLNGYKISGATASALVENNGVLTIINGTIENTAVNGGATINNKGTLTIDDANIVGAPIASDAGYPSYCITSSGVLTIEDGTSVSADRGCLFLSGKGETVINGGTFTNNDISSTGRAFTSHVVVVGYGANNKLTINDGTFQHLHTSTSGGVVINNWSAVTVDVKGGNFSGGNYFGKWDNLSDYGYGSTKTPFSVTGGTFTGMDDNYIADGYKKVDLGGKYRIVADDVKVPTTSDEASEAIKNGGDVILGTDVAYNTSIKNDATLDLNGNAFEAGGTIELGNNSDLTMTNGDYVVNGTYGHVDVRPSTAEGSAVYFENVNFAYNKLGPTYGPSTNRLGTVVEVCATVTDAHTKIVFKNCTFDNAQVLFEGMSGKTGTFEAVFENCTFNALTSSAPIYVQNYVKGEIKVVGCTFNLECTSSTASAISVSSSSSTEVTVIAENNTINATAATPTDSSVTGVDVVKVNGTPANIKFISAYANCTITETGTVKTGIAA